MKILLVSQEYPPKKILGGIGTQTFLKASGLTSLGHQVYIITSSNNADRHENIEDGIHVIRIPGMEYMLPEMTEIVQWITRSTSVAIEIENLNKSIGLDLIDFPELEEK